MNFRNDKPDNLQVFKSALRNRNIERLYFFHGEETFLLTHYVEQIKKYLLDELTESFNFHKLNSENFNVHAFAEAVENIPMMSEHSLVLVDDIDIFKLADADRQKIMEVLSDIPEYCTVIFTYITVAWNPDKRIRKLYDCIESNGMIVEFYKQSQRDLISWITRHFAAKEKKIPQELCAYLISITDGTMTSLAGEISKIAAYSGADVITKSDIDAVTEPVLDAIVFDMTDLLAQNQYGAALDKLQVLLKMQEDPISILNAISTHFRRIGVARILLDSGKNHMEFLRLYSNLREHYAKRMMNTARNFSCKFCAAAAQLILQTDIQLKTSFDNAPRLLEMLLLQLAQEAKNA